MDKEEVKKIVIEAAVEIDGKKKLSCPQAFELAKENPISLKEITKCCNQNNIKIYGCQLGCFK